MRTSPDPGTMRTLAAFAALMAVLMAVGVIAASAVLQRPPRDLFLPPPGTAECDDAYVVRATGGLAWLSLEGGMWEFAANGELYDLYGVERFLSQERVEWLRDHEGTHVPVMMEGIAEPCLATFHMRGVAVRVTALVEV
jgi:hypothetical protein